MRFCPACGSRLSVAAVAGRQRPACPACDFVHYRNPVPVVLVSATLNGKLLMVQRLIEPLKGYWAPPGGYVEFDETAEDAVVREVKEETNLDVAVDGLLNVYSKAGTGILFLVYRGRVVGGAAVAGEDAGAVGFFAPAELPGQPAPERGTLLDRWTFEVIGRVVEDYRKRSER